MRKKMPHNMYKIFPNIDGFIDWKFIVNTSGRLITNATKLAVSNQRNLPTIFEWNETKPRIGADLINIRWEMFARRIAHAVSRRLTDVCVDVICHLQNDILFPDYSRENISLTILSRMPTRGKNANRRKKLNACPNTYSCASLIKLEINFERLMITIIILTKNN